jgi:uncharacterized protein YegP (UPF0339 family)
MLKSLRTLGVALFLSALSPVAVTGCSDVAQDTQDATARQGRFEIFEGQDSQFYFRLVAGNGENVLRSEGYVSRSGAESGIASVKVNGIDAERYDVKENAAGEHYFNLVARNGQIIGTSEGYASKSNAERGVETVVRVVQSLVQEPLDGEVREAIEKAAEGGWYGALHGSESDYPFTYVEASLDAGEEITLELVREKFREHADSHPDSDGSIADMFGEAKSDWQNVGEICADPEDAEFNGYTEDCAQMAQLDAALAANLTDIQAYWFGTSGGPGYVDGVTIHIFIVGRTPDGNLAGVHTFTVWT